MFPTGPLSWETTGLADLVSERMMRKLEQRFHQMRSLCPLHREATSAMPYGDGGTSLRRDENQ